MSIEINEKEGGKVVVVYVSGRLEDVDYERFAPELARLAGRHGTLRVLFDLRDFHGWETSSANEDLKFGVEQLPDIERLAMVGRTRWQKGLATFVTPFAKAAFRYFDHVHYCEARRWLSEG